MSDIIRLLPDHVANQIAAGEVIQRPASVVKELLENAIDAGSTEIKLIIRDGGKTSIQVIDNGKGMSPTDARMCWERHATSKINKVEDIFGIRTMGFRGEALASIASVAMVELRTKRKEDAVGTLIRIEASEVTGQEVAATLDGTHIQVKNLFFNIPARKQFLKSDAVETRHIIDEFTRVALANPEVAMSMHHNGNETYELRSGDLAQRITGLFSLTQAQHILPVEEHTTIVGLTGFIGKPEYAKKTRGEQFFFVNKRYIRDPYLHHALMSCYENLIQKEQFPFYVLQIEIDPSLIDVNVHPTKTEIKFEDERAVYQIVKAVGKRALGQHYHIPLFEPSSPDHFLGLTQTPVQRETNDFKHSIPSFSKPAVDKDWQELYAVFNRQETIGDIRKEGFTQEEPVAAPRESLKRNMMQVHNSYILVQVASGILLIDQQAAHERILYERYLDKQHHQIQSQQRLFPRTITVSAAEEKIVEELLPEFHALGFDLGSLGKQTFIVNGVPPEWSERDEHDLILKFLDQYKQQTYAQALPAERFARIMAKQMSIPKGTPIRAEEMVTLVDELFACKEPQYTPEGKACVKTITLADLGKMMSGA